MPVRHPFVSFRLPTTQPPQVVAPVRLLWKPRRDCRNIAEARAVFGLVARWRRCGRRLQWIDLQERARRCAHEKEFDWPWSRKRLVTTQDFLRGIFMDSRIPWETKSEYAALLDNQSGSTSAADIFADLESPAGAASGKESIPAAASG
jgi:hypothetical protein